MIYAMSGEASRRVPLVEGEDVVVHCTGYKLKRFITIALQCVRTSTRPAIKHFLKLVTGYYR